MLQSLFDLTAVKRSQPLARIASGKSGIAANFSLLLGEARSALNGKPNGGVQAASPPLKGHALMAQLKQSLLSSGLTPDRLIADGEALAAFEKVLVGAGFDSEQVRNLLAELTANTEAKGIKLSTLFEGISKLKNPSPTVSEPKYLEISALPYLQTLLAEFGLTPEDADSVLNKAKIEGKGIDAAKLAYELKLMSSGAGSEAQSLKAAVSSEKMVEMLHRIGLSEAPRNGDAFDLNGLITALEKFADQKGSGGNKRLLTADESALAAAMAWAPVAQIAKQEIHAAQTGGEIGLNEEQVPFKSNRLAQLARNNGITAVDGSSIPQAQKDSAGQENGRIPVAQVAAVLEANAGLRNSVGIQSNVTGDWDLFVKKLRSASSEKESGTEAKTGARFSETEKFAMASLSRRSFVLFENKTDAGVNNGLAPNTSANAKTQRAGFDNGKVKTDGGFQVEAPLSSAVAKASDRGPESSIKTVHSFAKPEDFSGIVMGDSVARRAEAVDPISKTATQSGSPKTLPYYVLDQVSRQILRSRLANENEIQLRLNPPNLGRLKMTIENTADGLKVTIVAENTAARDMLLSNSGELKTALMDQGLRVDHIDVETQSNFDQAMADAHQGSDRSDGRKRMVGRARIASADDTTDAAILPVIENGQGALNLVV
jgi:flagellar hook-length control protein FliK